MGEVIADEDEIDDSRNDLFSPWINPFPDTDPLSEFMDSILSPSRY
jgi:hypothetical protein